MIKEKWKLWSLCVATLSIIFITVGCASSMDSAEERATAPGVGMDSDERSSWTEEAYPEEAVADYDLPPEYGMDLDYAHDDFADGNRGEVSDREIDEEAGSAGEFLEEDMLADEQRKIIREQYIEQQVQDLQAVLSTLEGNILSSPGAYIESLREWKNETRYLTEHRAQMIIRIPVADFPSFIAGVEKQGNILDRQITGQDVTEEYYDLEARLRGAKKHEERILELYDKADTIEDMLKIERELSRIQSNIEQMEGRQRFLQNVTSTVKLTLSLLEVEEEEFLSTQEETSMMKEAILGLQKTLKDILFYAERSVVYVVSNLPYLFVWIIFFTLLFWYGRKAFRRRFSNATEIKTIEEEARKLQQEEENQDTEDPPRQDKK